jgi:putative tricarboxylic transport membrane protein
VNMFFAVVFGIVGFFMVTYGYSRAAFILGFILGPMIEHNLYLAYSLDGIGFILQPFPLIALLIIVFLLINNIRKMRKRRVNFHA